MLLSLQASILLIFFYTLQKYPVVTLSIAQTLGGKLIKSKADNCLLHLNKHLAYWNEFCPGRKFPSGKNEIDALKYVIMKVNESNNDDAGFV